MVSFLSRKAHFYSRSLSFLKYSAFTMESVTILHSSTAEVKTGTCEDHDLAMASRESAQHASSIQNEAYRQALSELAGELYVEAYKSTMREAEERQRKLWNVSSE